MLNPYSRQVFVGYYLNKTKGRCSQLYVDAENQAFTVPETSLEDFQQLFNLSRRFRYAVCVYFKYLHYHFSITSRPFDSWEVRGENRMHWQSLDASSDVLLSDQKSVAVFKNGALLHVFGESIFFALKKRGIFRPGALSLTFDGNDASKIPSDTSLFSGLKSFNFNASEESSQAFHGLLDQSAASLENLTVYHSEVVPEFKDHVASLPKLKTLRTPLKKLASELDSYKKLLLTETSHLEVSMEMLVHMSELSMDPFVLSPKIEALSIQWSFWPEEIMQLVMKLSVNAPNLQTLRFRRRDLQEVHVSRYSYGGRRYFIANNTRLTFFNDVDTESALHDMQLMVANESQLFGEAFPFRMIFEQGLYLYDRRLEDKFPNSANPVDVQVAFQASTVAQMQLLKDGRAAGPATDLKVADHIVKSARKCMCKLWPQLGRHGEIAQFDGEDAINTFTQQRV